MALLLSNDDVRDATRLPAMIDVIERAFRDEHSGLMAMPERLSMMNDGDFMRLMPVRMDGLGIQGYKSFHGSLAAGVRYLVVLCSTDGEFLGLLDAAYLTAARTGATSGVATRHLTAEKPVSVGLIGSGLEAETNLAAVAAVRDIESVRVFSRSPERRENFAQLMGRSLEASVSAVEHPQDAVKGADVVITATNTGMNGEPAYHADWMEPGQFIISIGATSPFLRELEAECFNRADHVVFDTYPEQVISECGDLLGASESLLQKMRKAPTLASVVAGVQERPADGQTTIFKSVGSAAQDISAAKSVVDVASEMGLGMQIGEIASNKQF